MKKFIIQLGFVPKENTTGIFIKKYPLFDNYSIEVDFEKEKIVYGTRIKSESKTTQNFSQSENWVVLECVNRLLEKGYKPEDITLEKTFQLGHNSGGRLDVFVEREGKAYLMIECKTWGREFNKEWANTQKKGGQLLSYLQQDKNAEFLILYASHLDGQKIQYHNEIIKVEEDYRLMASNTEDLYNRWNKLSKQNGLFDDWVSAYHFESKALTPELLKPIQQEDSSFIFNRFLEILRHNTVSDKGNAFNKIFTLFLCKVYDEKTTKNGDELRFQWLEGKDNNVTFQVRLTDLYKNGMLEFLEKQVTDFSEDDFEKKYKHLDDSIKKLLLEDFFKVRLQKNNEFAIKDVFDEQSFEENAKVVKEVVELLQEYRIRYNKRQQYLSDFFELLLTTGLKQESGQFFTPVPVAQFIIKSLPLDRIIDEKIEKGERNNILPYIIDYAAGSGHFLTESMHEIQGIVNKKNPSDFIPDTAKKLKAWQEDHFDWATQYVYGVEKDYRLVKVGKVGCYLHGDGLANVILSDGLARFDHKEYKGKLAVADNEFPQDNKQFDIVVSNPPYSVSSFINTSRSYYTEKDFELYSRLTESSSEIECLFIERTKQLLKDGGIAGIILPSSILNNGGAYTRARGIILDYFDIVAVTELGSNTFMATGTNTVVLFLRRRNNYESINLRQAVDKFFITLRDVIQNGIENPVAKYISHVWEGITYDDYLSLLQKSPNEAIAGHEIYQSYQKKITTKTQKELIEKILEREKEKIYTFILAYPQQIVLIKSGEKDAEKRFLGYEFSHARGREGIHPIQGGKTIDECTKLFDAETFENPEKASTYIYQAFNGDFETPVHESLTQNISRHGLVDMMNFDRPDFEKTVSLSVKKKIKIESKWEISKLNSLMTIVRGASPRPIKNFITDDPNGVNWIKIGDVSIESKFITQTQEKITQEGAEKSRRVKSGDFVLSNSMSFGRPYIMATDGCIHDGWLLLTNFNKRINKDYLYNILSYKITQEQFSIAASGGTAVDNLNIEKVSHVQIPLPPLDIQQKIVDEIEIFWKREMEIKHEILKWKNDIEDLFERAFLKADMAFRLSDSDIFDVSIGQRVLKDEFVHQGSIPVYSANVMEPFGYINKLLIEDFITPSVLWGIDGDWMVNWIASGIPFYPTDHCGILRVKNGAINEKYLAYVLRKEGSQIEFSRQKRASIDRIQGIKIQAPPLSEQQKIVVEIEKIESEIAVLEGELASIPAQKEAVIKKYL